MCDSITLAQDYPGNYVSSTQLNLLGQHHGLVLVSRATQPGANHTQTQGSASVRRLAASASPLPLSRCRSEASAPAI